jgi:clorobiocin biosynthesis protein CloN5
MTTAITGADVFDRLAGFIRRELLGDDDGTAGADDLDATTPLLQTGILNSMNTARLLTFIRAEFGLTVSPMYITGTHFKDLGAVTALVLQLSNG